MTVGFPRSRGRPGPTDSFFKRPHPEAWIESPTTPEIIASELDGYEFENGTIYDALDGKDLEWRVYHGDDFPVVGALAGMDLATMATNFHGLDDFASDLKDSSFDSAYVFIEPNYGHVLTHGSNFQCGNSEHPIDDVTRGDALIKYVYDAIRQSPCWESSVLVVLYDEHGGFYDHVAPPPAVPPGDATDPANNGHGFRFDRQGVRVPAVIASPFIPSLRAQGALDQNCNLIDHTQYDHGSLLATIEDIYGLSPLTQRDARAASFASLLSLASPRTDAIDAMPRAKDSGWSCGEDPVPSAGGKTRLPDPPAMNRETPPNRSQRLFGVLSSSAALADARLHPTEKKRIRMRLMSIRTIGDARSYLGEVSPQLRAHKTALAATGLSTAATRTKRIERRAVVRRSPRPASLE